MKMRQRRRAHNRNDSLKSKRRFKWAFGNMLDHLITEQINILKRMQTHTVPPTIVKLLRAMDIEELHP